MIVIVIIAISACAPSAQVEQASTLPEEPKNAPERALAEANQPLPSPEPVLATPISDAPAAGICAEPEDEIVTVVIQPDIPSPRCVKVHPTQRLSVQNETDLTYTLSLGALEAEVGPGQVYTFEETFGEILLPGVHRLELSDAPGGPEIWLVEGSG